MFSGGTEWGLRITSTHPYVDFTVLGKRRREAMLRGRAFTINHHRCQQAPLLATQSVMGLALLVPEAGHTLGAGQVLTGGVLYAGPLAVCASRPRARRKKICVSQLVWWKQQGVLDCCQERVGRVSRATGSLL